MDVHYKPDAWQEMKEGIDKLTKDALIELKHANDLLEKIESKIHSLDSDRSIHFQHSSQQGKINRLLDDYITLGNYCTKAGEAVSRHIDEPFYKDMDKFAGKMRDLSIRNYSTENRIGSTSTTTLPNAHGYGMAQTITTKKDKITVDDIFKDSLAFDKVLRAQYKEIKQENPDAKLDYAEYRKLVPSMRGFEYKTREDEQKKLETFRDLAIGAGLIILTIACPPAGLTASALYGGLQIKSAYDGKDWGTGRKLSDAERAENGIFGALDAIPVLGTAAKGFKGLGSAASLAKLSKLQDAGKVINPNTGKNVVQSLHNSKNIMLDRMKLGSLKVEKYGNDKMYQLGGKLAKSIDNMTAKTKTFEINEHGVITAKQGGTDLHGWLNKHHTESSKIIDDKIKGVEGSLAKGTDKTVTEGARYGERKISDQTYAKLRRASPSSKIQREVNKNIDDIIGTEDFALPGKIIDKKLHADHIVSLERMARMEGFETLTYNQQKEIANFVENFIGLSEAANTSKGSKSFADWYIYKKENILVNPEFREKMILKEKELEIKIQEMIDEFNRINKKE
ncbi:hypothetical protein [Bacillus rhizoplanae]|uniref:hypothetical protein n=1 Tax=Bacillus rhizoplanae TaxID=2880966 RepID=UPI003D22CB3E